MLTIQPDIPLDARMQTLVAEGRWDLYTSAQPYNLEPTLQRMLSSASPRHLTAGIQITRTTYQASLNLHVDY